ncbi:TonB-dependent receptor [Edaphobacter aggregans]|uniref:TonB-dependent receptor n=1 Tax=Edaphobacter aggregans TaxID=570835 RepID=UPI00054EF92D|nr:carboxypeptidase regulatory-like domain-containing protein [Edaphobacter aggregans]
MKYLCFCLLLLILCVTIFATAQSTDATISGVVVDTSGGVIPDADILILNEATGVQFANRTNGAGIYTVSVLPPGQYRVQVSKGGFKTLIKPGIILNVQSAVALNFTLPVGVASESITVEAGSSTINTNDASVSTVIDRKFVENMPLNGRSFQDLISMTPGVVTQSPQATGLAAGYSGDFSVNGQRTESNYYTVDGVSGNVSSGTPRGYSQISNTGSIASSSALGTTQSLVSVDALQEFRVSSSTYSAEYGRTPGGQFSFGTRSGTNTPHGTAFDYLRNDYFDANDWFNDHNGIRQPALRQNDFGGTFGSPIVIPSLYNGHSKSFLFASYEGLRLVQPTAAATMYVPSLAVRSSAVSSMQGVLNAYPAPTGPEITDSSGNLTGLSPFVKAYSLPGQIDSTSVRVDHTLSPKLVVFFRYGYTPSSISTRNLSQLNASSINTSTYTFGATSPFSGWLTNELRLGFSDSTSRITSILDSFGGAVPTDLYAAFGVPGGVPTRRAESYIYVSTVGTAYITANNTSNGLNQWNLTDSVTMQHANHQWKLGIDYRHIVSALNPPAYDLDPDFYTRQSLLTGVASDVYTQRNISSKPVFKEFSLYAQDTWRAARSLTIDYGFRWEVNPAPTEANGNDAYTLLGDINTPSTLALAPHGTSLWKTSWYNFAPRLGAAWTAHSQPGWETVLRSGGGVFFDTGNQIATSGFSGIGFNATADPTNVSLPLSASQVNLPTTPTAPYTSFPIYAFPQHQQLPYTLQWNLSLEQALGHAQSFALSYIGSDAHRLLQEQRRTVTPFNSNFGTIYFFPNGVTANYNALQFKFQRAVAKGVQALASYTWSHSLDYGSTNAAYPFTYGNSDYDIRNNLQAGVSWDLPSTKSNSVVDFMTRDWGLDGRFSVRGGYPITFTGNLLRDPVTGNQYYSGVNYDSSKSVYIFSSRYPGGRAVNKAAFTLPTGTSAGNAPRNFARGFGAQQVNFAARRSFPLTDKASLQFRAEAFNVFNHPNFGFVQSVYSNALFGQATKMLNQSLGTMSSLYQQGGARSMQFAVKLIF